MVDLTLSPFSFAPQHGPRPLPLFLTMLRSETAQSPQRRIAALAGLAAYQAAPRPAPRPPRPTLATAGCARLVDHGGQGRPVVFVPSLINPPFILDLAPENSLMAFIAAAGFRTLMIDWGDPAPMARGIDVTAHVEQLMLPLLDSLDEPPILVGYCLGGTLALGAAAAMPVAGLAAIATPWHFSGFGDAALREIDALWEAAEPACNRLGLVPMEVLQSGFWRLDPGRTIAKYERFATLAPDSEAAHDFVILEDWANTGAPLTYAAGRQLFDDFFSADLSGSGRWRVAGHRVDPHALDCPTIEFVSRTDRIVPMATAADLAERHDLGLGHVGMIVGGRARAQLWEPLLGWISRLGGAR